MRAFVFIALILAISGCNYSALDHDPKAVFGDQDVYRLSQSVAQRVAEKDVEGFIALAHPDALDQPDLPANLEKLFESLPAGSTLDTQLYYAELRSGEEDFAGTPIYLTAYDVVGETNFAQLIIAVAPLKGECCVTTFWQLTPYKSRPSTLGDFTFDGKGPMHFIVFGLLIGVPIFMIVSVIACWRNPAMTRKPLWMFFILIGLWGFKFNWANGAVQNELLSYSGDVVSFNWLQLHLLGTSFFKAGPFAPWILTIGMPLGAICYWALAARKKTQADEV